MVPAACLHANCLLHRPGDCWRKGHHQSPAPSIARFHSLPLSDSEVAILHFLTNILLNRADTKAKKANNNVPPIKQTPAPALEVTATTGDKITTTVTPVHHSQPAEVQTAPKEHPAPLLRVPAPADEPTITYPNASAPKKRRSRRPTKPTAKKLENDLHRHHTLGNSPNEATSLPPQIWLIANTTPSIIDLETVQQQSFSAIHANTGELAEYQKVLKSSEPLGTKLR